MEDQVPNVRSDWAWVVAAPLGCPVVPDVKMRSDTSSGPTAAARAAVSEALTRSPAARSSCRPRIVTPAGPPAAASPSSRRTTMRPSAPVSCPASMAG